MQTRCIIMTDASGNREHVVFTEDLDCEASDYCPPGFIVDTDATLGIELPSSFPMDYTLVRE